MCTDKLQNNGGYSMNSDPRNIFVNQRMPNGSEQTEKQPSDREQTDKQPNATNATPKYDDLPLADKKKVLTDLANKYQREGEGQLVKDIIANVVDQKARGLLSNQQLQEFARRVTPMLNGDQKQRLAELLDQLIKL